MPDVTLLSAACMLLIAGVFGVAVSSIATECYDKNETFKKDKKDNYTFIIVNLVCNILVILGSFASIYLAISA
jgi:dipeptide/tripeptide permease